MAQFRIKVGDNPPKVVGADGCTTLTIQIVGGSDFDPPQVFATAYVRSGEKVLKRNEWKFPTLSERDTVSIERAEAAKPDKPDQIGYGNGGLLSDESAWVKTEIKALQRQVGDFEKQAERVKAQSATGHNPSFYCSFCGKAQGEVCKLIAGPAVFICDECISLAHEIATEKEK